MSEDEQPLMLTRSLAVRMRALLNPSDRSDPDWASVASQFGMYSVFVLIEKDPLDGDQYLRGAFLSRPKADAEAAKADALAKQEQPPNASFNAYVRVCTMTISELLDRRRWLVESLS